MRKRNNHYVLRTKRESRNRRHTEYVEHEHVHDYREGNRGYLGEVTQRRADLVRFRNRFNRFFFSIVSLFSSLLFLQSNNKPVIDAIQSVISSIKSLALKLRRVISNRISSCYGVQSLAVAAPRNRQGIGRPHGDRDMASSMLACRSRRRGLFCSSITTPAQPFRWPPSTFSWCPIVWTVNRRSGGFDLILSARAFGNPPGRGVTGKFADFSASRGSGPFLAAAASVAVPVMMAM